MAQETLISPGVLSRENDLSQITQLPPTVGLALVGPTVKGQPNIPTVVTSYSDYINRFGGSFVSGGASYEFLTSVTAYNYFQQGGQSILVTRVTSGSFTPATSSIIPNSITGGTEAYASMSMTFTDVMFNDWYKGIIFTLGGFDDIKIAASSWQGYDNYSNTYFINTYNGGSWGADTFGAAAVAFINNTPELYAKISASYNPSTNLFAVTASNPGTDYNGTLVYGGQYTYWSYDSFPSSSTFAGGDVALSTIPTFVLETLSYGSLMNNTSSILSNGALSSGSSENVKWEVKNVNTGSGTFTLLIHRGDDNPNTPVILETYTNVSLDPNSVNYIEQVIGNQAKTVLWDADMGGYYINNSGNYRNNSRYVRVKSVNYPTPNYLDNAGNVGVSSTGTSYSSSLPLNGTGSNGGSFGGATGNDIPFIGNTLFNNIGTTTQGLRSDGTVDHYITASNILSNKDEYDYELLVTPGLCKSSGHVAIADFIQNAEDRGDYFYITDLTPYGVTIGTPSNQANSLDTNYAGAYWPWVQVVSQETGKLVWVPTSTVMAGVYAFNDNVSAEWFAPAGLNRGGLGGVIQAERKLSPTNRDNLYINKVNPIATFPNVGVTAFGQKTLQQKASALDRINVRRLLIALKRYIGGVAKTLIFEQNTTVTRNRFLSQVTPYLESVQQRQGLYTFKVVMDETNNTPDVIDRNQLVGQIYLQPTRTAEFILLDFNILPTGVEFGS